MSTWCFLQVSSQLAFRFRRRSAKQTSKIAVMEVILDFGRILAVCFIYKSPWCFPSSFKSISPSVQQKKRKVDFQDDHLECPIGKILAIFDLQVNPDAFCKASSQLAFRFRRNETNRFLWWHPSWSSDLAIFNPQVTQMLPTKFQVNWLLNSGAEAKKIFSSWPSWQPIRISYRNDFNIFWSTRHPDAWISDRNNFSSFWSTTHLNAFYKVSSQLAFRFRRRSEDIDFKDSGHGRHLGFPIGIILVFFFYLQVTPMLTTQFQVSRSEKNIFKMTVMAASTDFWSEWF